MARRKRKKLVPAKTGKAEKKAAPRKSTPLANDDIEFRVTWEPGVVTASLDHLVYDDVLVSELPEYGDGNVMVSFQRSTSLVHRFEWSLLFPGRTLSNLGAAATINGVEGVLGNASQATNRWAADGDWDG